MRKILIAVALVGLFLPVGAATQMVGGVELIELTIAEAHSAMLTGTLITAAGFLPIGIALE